MHGDELLRMVKGIPPEQAEGQDPLLLMGSSLLSTHLLLDLLSGSTYVNMVASSLSLVSGNPSPMMVVNHSMPTLEGWEDTNSD